MQLDRLHPAEVITVGKVIALLDAGESRLVLERNIMVLEAARQVCVAELDRVRELERE